MKQRLAAISGVCAAALLGLIIAWGGVAAKPVAAMELLAQHLRHAKSSQFTMTMEVSAVREPGVPAPGTNQGVRANATNMVQRVSWKAPDSYRIEFKRDQSKEGWDATDIFPGEKTGIRLNHKTKQFQRVPAPRANPWMMLDQLSKFSGDADRELGAKEINGKQAWGFEIDGKKIDSDAYPGPVEIWLNAESNLPVLVRYEMRSPAMTKPMTLTIDSFRWNTDLAAELFDASAPSGYVAQPKSKVEHPGAEKVLEGVTLAFKTYAELCGGHYPHIQRSFGEPVRDEMFKAAGLAIPPTAEQRLHGEKFRQVSEAFSGFAIFNRVIRANPDVAYYGKTVGPNDSEKVLLRWKLEDGAYQIIFGDLHNEIVTEEQLKRIEGK